MKAILFDSWGTLIENGVKPSPLRQVQEILRVRLPFSEFVQQFEKSFMTRKYTDLGEAFYAAIDDLGIRVAPFVVEKLIGLWNKNMLFANPFEDVAELGKLKQKYKIGLISNTDPFSLIPVLKKHDLIKYFDVIVLSCDVGLLKTDPKMYEVCLQQLGVSKEDSVMVGDSLQTDVEGAINAGIRAILMDRKDRREYDPKVTSLKQLAEVLDG